MTEEQFDRILAVASKESTYCFMTPLHTKSETVEALGGHYGSFDKLRSGTFTEDGRIKLIGDIL